MGYCWMRSAMYVGLCFIFGTVFHNIGNSYFSIQEKASAFTFIIWFLSFMVIGGCPSFIEDMKVYQTERMNGHYSVGAFATANTLSSMPITSIIAIVATAIVYPLLRLHSCFIHVIYFVLVLYGCLLVSEPIMMVVASWVSNFLLGILLGSGVWVRRIIIHFENHNIK